MNTETILKYLTKYLDRNYLTKYEIKEIYLFYKRYFRNDLPDPTLLRLLKCPRCNHRFFLEMYNKLK